MSSKIGRPVIGKAKTNDVKVRLDDDMHSKLLKYCSDNELTKAEAIRKAIDLLLSKIK